VREHRIYARRASRGADAAPAAVPATSASASSSSARYRSLRERRVAGRAIRTRTLSRAGGGALHEDWCRTRTDLGVAERRARGPGRRRGSGSRAPSAVGRRGSLG
jgi:hypothetical protein